MVLDVVAKNAPHDRRLRLVDLEVRRSAGAACNTPIPIGAFPGGHLPGTSTPQLAASVSLSDLGAFILGYHALHLGQ